MIFIIIIFSLSLKTYLIILFKLQYLPHTKKTSEPWNIWAFIFVVYFFILFFKTQLKLSYQIDLLSRVNHKREVLMNRMGNRESSLAFMKPSMMRDSL